VSGFEADLAAIGITAGVLGNAAEAVAAAVDRLDGASGLGPGRLDAVTGALIAGTRDELSGVLGAVKDDAALVESIRGGYAALDEDIAASLRRAGGESW
jgi:3-oxoacyl-ACP reductase-like protein